MSNRSQTSVDAPSLEPTHSPLAVMHTQGQDIYVPNGMPCVYTPEQAAAILQCGVHFLRDGTRNGELPHLRINRSAVRFTSDDIKEIMSMFAVKPMPQDEPEQTTPETMAIPETYEEEDLSEYPGGSLKTRRRMKKLIDERNAELAAKK